MSDRVEPQPVSGFADVDPHGGQASVTAGLKWIEDPEPVLWRRYVEVLVALVASGQSAPDPTTLH